MIRIHIYNPDTLLFERTVVSPIEIPWNSTQTEPYDVQAPQYFVGGVWTFDDPNTPEVELPVIPITSVSLSNASLMGNIWSVDAKTVFNLTAKAHLPEGQLTVIVDKVVNKETVEDLRFRAMVTPLTDDPEGNLLTLPLYFEASGNYQIDPERLNNGLAEIGAPFRVSFAKVDIDALVVIPT